MGDFKDFNLNLKKVKGTESEISMKKIEERAKKIGLTNIIEYLLFWVFLYILSYFKTDESSILPYDSLALFFAFLIPSMFILKINFKKMFFKKNKLNIKSRIVLIIIFISMYLVGATIEQLLNLNALKTDMFLNLNFKMIIVREIIVSITEEIIFRGIILENLREFGDDFAIICSSAIFGLMHQFGMISAFVSGVFMGILYVITGNLRSSICFHIFMNLVLTIILYILHSMFPTIGLDIDMVILTTFFLVIGIIVFNISRKKNKEMKNFNINKLCSISRKIRDDKEKYKVFFGEAMMLLIILFTIGSMVIEILEVIC
ncbi:Abortive infection protein [Clostridium botulinum B str. Osaka05]|uniref:Abortive infection protein n=1 Tax=Clostridium botulinum B str. Osaka05 TaxID=1407017 RepID=A0A0S6U0M1_CLOBO|nr:type II CAAX endopeptidase family protein [Clostridium botulinum]GAE01457.1 Abortive infection protein [Clostridium botulinum B str. Osaka05]